MTSKKCLSFKAMFFSVTLMVVLLVSSLQIVYCQKTVQIGVIAPNGIDNYAAIISIANEDINEYMASKGLAYRFTYIIEDAQGNADLHLKHVLNFRSMGINLLIGGGWTGQAEASLSYVNENDMLLFSPSSTMVGLSIPNDNLFRLAISERWYNLAEAEVMWSWGIDAATVLYPHTRAGDYEQFVDDFTTKGGKAIHGHEYEAGTTSFHEVVSRVEADAMELVDVFGREYVGLLLLTSSMQDLLNIIEAAMNSPSLYILKWFTRAAPQQFQNIIETMPSEAEHLKLFCVEQHIPDAPKVNDVENRFVSLIGMPFNVYTANIYDICWIYALSVFSTDSVNAITIKKVLPDISAGYNGITGNCMLDENGDRAPNKFDVWGVGDIDGNIQSVKYAYYDFSIKDTVWDASLITPIRDGVTPVNIPPFAVINGPYSGQVNSPISFSSAGSHDPNGNIVEYNWNFGDGNTATSENPSHTYINAGTYTVTLTVRDNQGAINMATTQCTVTIINQAPIAVINGPYSGEEDSPISFSSAGSNDPEGGSIEYRWDFGDGQTSTSTNPSHTYEEEGTYTVTLMVTDNQGATNTATTSCTVEAASQRGGFPWLPIVVALVAVAAVAAYLYLQKMKPRVKVRKPVEFDIGIEPKEIPADGRSTAIITIRLLDDEGKPFEAREDMAVTISASDGVVVSSSEVKKDEVTGATTITDSVKQAIEGLLSRREETGMRLSIKQGERDVEAAIVSSLQVGDVTLSVSGPGIRRKTVTMRFTEKRRYCMHCGASMSILDRACPNPKCGLMPPSGVDVKSCPNCGEVIPSLAKFCSECGAGQPKQQ